jgi:hypothetical protein
MNKFKNKWIFIVAIIVIILGIVIYYDNDDISNLISNKSKDYYDSSTTSNDEYYSVCKKKDFYIGVYEYNDSVSEGEKGYCISGKEDTCSESKCYKDKNVGSCLAGTIVHYYVNETEDYYFNVLHDDGDTLTLQSVDAITQSAWGTSATVGPVTALTAITEATKDWNNVNDLNYELGTTIFLKNPNNSDNANPYTYCSAYNRCTSNSYILSSYLTTNVKARLSSVQEYADLGCSSISSSCPTWFNIGIKKGCWLINSNNKYPWLYYYNNKSIATNSNNAVNDVYNLRAVVEINK